MVACVQQDLFRNTIAFENSSRCQDLLCAAQNRPSWDALYYIGALQNRQLATKTAGMQDRRGLLQDFDASASASEDEKGWQSAEMEGGRELRGRGCLRRVAEYGWLITTSLLLMILAVQLAIWNGIRSKTGCPQQVGGDHMHQAESFPTELVQWKADYDFVPLNATEFLRPEVQTKWESLYPGLFASHTRPPTRDEGISTDTYKKKPGQDLGRMGWSTTQRQ